MISEERAERAVEFIRDNAKKYGDLVGLCKFLDHKRRVVRGEAFVNAEGTVAEREAISESSDEYREVVNDLRNAWADRTTLETQLKGAELTIEVWRSENKWADRGHT